MIIMKKIKEIITGLLLALAAAVCIFEADTVRLSVVIGIERCLAVIIPSLYAMMAVSGLLIKSGAVSAAGRFFDRPARALFGMSGGTLLIFLFSNIAGYPVGAKMLLSRYESGEIAKKEAELLSGLCFGAGPAFISGCIAARLYGSPAPGTLVVISTASANLILAAVMSPYFRRHTKKAPSDEHVHFRADMLPECISSAGRSMAEICFAVIAFSVLTGLLVRCGAIPFAAGLVSSVTGRDNEAAAGLIVSALDITAVSGLPAGDHTLLPAISALVSFGGACVFMQITAIFKGKLSIAPAVLLRAASALISYGICRMLLPVFIAGKTAYAAAMRPQLHSAPSPVPSLLLAIMTAMVFYEYERSKRARRK